MAAAARRIPGRSAMMPGQAAPSGRPTHRGEIAMQDVEPIEPPMTWRVRLRGTLWVLLFGASLAALGVAAATVGTIAVIYPDSHFSQWPGTTPEFSRSVADQAFLLPFWLAGAGVLSVLVALLGWWRCRTPATLHLTLALLTCLNLMLGFAATASVLAGYFVLPPTKSEALLREDAAR
jgi:hypothetical protein